MNVDRDPSPPKTGGRRAWGLLALPLALGGVLLVPPYGDPLAFLREGGTGVEARYSTSTTHDPSSGDVPEWHASGYECGETAYTVYQRARARLKAQDGWNEVGSVFMGGIDTPPSPPQLINGDTGANVMIHPLGRTYPGSGCTVTILEPTGLRAVKGRLNAWRRRLHLL